MEIKIKVKVGKVSFQNGRFSAVAGIVDGNNGCYLSAEQLTFEHRWEEIKGKLKKLQCSYSLGTLLRFQISGTSPEEFLEIIKELDNLARLLKLANYSIYGQVKMLDKRIKSILKDLYYE